MAQQITTRSYYHQPEGSESYTAKRARQKQAAQEQPAILHLSSVERMILKAYRRPDLGIPNGDSDYEEIDGRSVLIEMNAPMERGKTKPNKPKFPTRRDATGKVDLSYRQDDHDHDTPWGEWVRWQAEQAASSKDD